MQSQTMDMFKQRAFIASSLRELLGESIYSIYDKSANSLKAHGVQKEFLFGHIENTIILENGSEFKIDWVNGQKTGFFLDQRDNRELLYSLSMKKKVLNAFSYSGGFSITALMGGANHVDSVDLSQVACDLVEENARLNNCDERHAAIKSDVQEFLKTMEKDYDIVVLDPPAFAKRRKAVHKAVQAYKRLNATAIKRMQPGTLLLTFSCSQNVSPQLFTDTIRAAAIEVGRPIQILRELRQPNDHQENLYFPEGHYLKGLLLRIG